MKSILITGGSGFVGLYTALKFMDEGYRTILCSRNPREAPLLDGKAGLWEYVSGDVSGDCRTILEAVRRYRVEGIIHSALPGSMPNPMQPAK